WACRRVRHSCPPRPRKRLRSATTTEPCRDLRLAAAPPRPTRSPAAERSVLVYVDGAQARHRRARTELELDLLADEVEQAILHCRQPLALAPDEVQRQRQVRAVDDDLAQQPGFDLLA